MLFDFLAVRLNGPKAAEVDLTLNLHFTDDERDFVLRIGRGVLNHRADRRAEDADVSLSLTRIDFIRMLGGQVEMKDLMADDRAEVDGSLMALRSFGGLFDRFDPAFPIVTP
ncbi:MAG: alkyl sulfatase C-terminal domain-containing protein [Gammaproteobacteria bacterium]|nr:alkyl sulfatase C-terminal domain-containing protein [Gammaproteobacteria bacterium]